MEQNTARDTPSRHICYPTVILFGTSIYEDRGTECLIHNIIV